MSRHVYYFFFFFSSRRRHTRCGRDWSSDVCSSDLDLVFDSDGRGQAAEEQPSWFQNSPGPAQHRFKMIVGMREVEDGAAEDDIRESVWEGGFFDGLDAEVRCG